MAEYENEGYEEPGDEGGEQQESPNIKQLRERANRAAELEKQLTKLQRDNAFLAAGVKTDEGLGELIAKTYDGDPDPEKVREYATKYGYEFGEGSGGHQDSEQDQERDQAQQRLDQMRGAGEGMKPRGIDDEIAEAEQAGNASEAIRLKSRKFLETRGSKR